MRKISHPPGFDPRIVQPVASHYTNCAIAAHKIFLKSTNKRIEKQNTYYKQKINKIRKTVRRNTAQSRKHVIKTLQKNSHSWQSGKDKCLTGRKDKRCKLTYRRECCVASTRRVTLRHVTYNHEHFHCLEHLTSMFYCPATNLSFLGDTITLLAGSTIHHLSLTHFARTGNQIISPTHAIDA